MKNYKNDLITPAGVNLIPSPAAPTGSYICTWWNQSSAANALGLTGTGLSDWRDALNEDALFEREDLYHHAPREVRGDLVFLLDDGWDVPPVTPGDDEHRSLHGSLDPDPEKFSRYGDDAPSRLKAISDKVKEMGYAGLGLWVSPQKSTLRGYDSVDDRTYWETRAKWSRDAGVLYWKVDWGLNDASDDYRQLISECVHKIYPDLLCEHAVVQKPCTHNSGSDTFLEDRLARVKRQMTFSDVYRTYDVIDPFEHVCTLQRAHEVLLSADEPCLFGRGLINGEHLYSICAGLGLAAGIMNYSIDALACINWHRFAPPAGIRDLSYLHSENDLYDSLFCESELCGWAPCLGRTVVEKAPAIMARGCPLPEVAPVFETAPFVCASKDKSTGAYCVASIKRTVDPVQNAHFPADVTVTGADLYAPIGVFGIFNSLTVKFLSRIPEGTRVLSQDLTGCEAFDVTALVKFDGDSMTLDGRDLRMLGKWDRGHRDTSDPSLILKMEI